MSFTRSLRAKVLSALTPMAPVLAVAALHEPMIAETQSGSTITISVVYGTFSHRSQCHVGGSDGRPVILAVDDEPQVLNAVERDLRQHYGRDFRVGRRPG